MIPSLPSRPRSLAQRLGRFFLEPDGAQVALEFSSLALLGAHVEWRAGRPGVRALASEPLTEGAFSPTLDNPGFVRKEEIVDAAKRVLAKIAALPSARTAFVVPDVIVRFRLFAPEEVRAEFKKRDALLAFRMQKLLPFPPADTRVIPVWPKSPTDPVLGIGFSQAVLGAYEQLGQAFGLDVGSIETSSMALLKGLLLEGDALLVRHDPAWLTVTLTRNGWPVSLRTFDAGVAQRPEEIRREIASTAVFWRDRLGGERLAAALVHASDAWIEGVTGSIAAAFGSVAQRAQPPSNLMIAGMPNAIQRSAAPALALLGASY